MILAARRLGLGDVVVLVAQPELRAVDRLDHVGAVARAGTGDGDRLAGSERRVAPVGRVETLDVVELTGRRVADEPDALRQ